MDATQVGAYICAHLIVLCATRLIAKRKCRVRGLVKWLSIVDLLLMQTTIDVAYWIAWGVWCLWWDVYDREFYKTATGMGFVIMCARSLWVMQTNTFYYIPSVVTSILLTYASMFRAAGLHL